MRPRRLRGGSLFSDGKNSSGGGGRGNARHPKAQGGGEEIVLILLNHDGIEIFQKMPAIYYSVAGRIEPK